MQYDVVIVGAGPAGIFAAYELTRLNPTAQVLLVEKGQSLDRRFCPLLTHKMERCPVPAKRKEYAGCQPACAITSGWGGAGAYSDGKFNLTTEFGGWLPEYLPPAEVLALIEYVDGINLAHGATAAVTDPTTPAVAAIERRATAAGLKLLKARVRHLGTEENLRILENLWVTLQPRLSVRFSTMVDDIIVADEEGGRAVRGVRLAGGEEVAAEQVIAAPGRDGAEWLAGLLQRHGLPMLNNQVDIGVRVETSNIVMQELNEHLYEAKFIFNSSVGARVRTFCANPGGYVVVENNTGVVVANGHSYQDPALGSPNTNFALLVSHEFTAPFNKPFEYAKDICRRANYLADGSVIVQKYGDIRKGRRSTEKRIREGFVAPTLREATPGDLGLVLPYNTMKSLLEMIEALARVAPGLTAEHTLFYGVEAKFYSARPRLTNHLETEIRGLYAIGDGAGVTRGLAQAAAAGVHVARHIGGGLPAG